MKVRLYRDRQQFDDEQRKTSARNSSSTSDLFRGEANLQLRVKSSHELMHLKAFLADHAILRDGSANWSPTGLKRQDNNLRLSGDAAQIAAFVHTFEAMWTRNNEVVQ